MTHSLTNNYFLFRFIQKIKLIFFGCISIFFTTLFLIPAFFLRNINFLFIFELAVLEMM